MRFRAPPEDRIARSPPGVVEVIAFSLASQAGRKVARRMHKHFSGRVAILSQLFHPWEGRFEMKRKVALIVVVAGVSLGAWAGAGIREQKQEPGRISETMQLKLKHAQNVLKGLAIEDFDAISDDAKNLSLLSQTAEWQVYRTPEYKHFSAEFRRASDSLAWQAEAKNIDAAALAYVQVTLTCVNCHKHVRTIRVADASR